MAQPFPPDRPTAYAPHETPTPRPRKPWVPAAAGFVIGLVVAVAAGAVLVATDVVTFGSGDTDAGGVSAAPVSLPSTLGGLQDLATANRLRAGSSPTAAKAVAAQEALDKRTAAATVTAYQAADPGAAVGYGSYASADLLSRANIVAVRAHHPGLTIGPVTDAADLGLAVPPQQVRILGDVQCSVYQSEPTKAGAPVDPRLDVTSLCQRSGPQLTVQVFGSNFSGPAGQQQMVAVTNAAYTSLAS